MSKKKKTTKNIVYRSLPAIKKQYIKAEYSGEITANLCMFMAIKMDEISNVLITIAKFLKRDAKRSSGAFDKIDKQLKRIKRGRKGKRKLNKYTQFVGEKMKEGYSMKMAAKMWRELK